MILTRELESRSHAEKDAGEDGDGDGEGEDVEIERDYGFVGYGVLGQQSDDGFDSTIGEEHAQSTAGQRKEHAFGEKLLNDALGAGTHGGADGDFTAARAGAGEQKIGDVGAGDEEEKANGGHQGDERVGEFSENAFVDGHELSAERRFGVVEGRVGLEELEVELLKFGVDLLARDTGPDAHHRAIARVVIGTNRDGSVDVGVIPGEANRKDADDCVELIVEPKRLAEDVASTEEMALPEGVAQQRDRRAVDLIFFGQKGAADRCADAER